MKSFLRIQTFHNFNFYQFEKINFNFIRWIMLCALFGGMNAVFSSPKNKKIQGSNSASNNIQNQLSPFQKIANTPNSDPNINPISEQQKAKINGQLEESRLFIENKGQFNAPGETNPILFQCDADGYRIAISKKGLHYYFIKNENLTDEINKIQPIVTNPLTNNSLTTTKEMGSNNTDAFSDLDPSKKLKNVELKTTAYRVDLSLLNSSSPSKITKENPGSIYYNHYFGNNEFAQVRGYQKIRMHDVYPGIDWVIYIKNGKVKYDFEINKNHASLHSLKLEFKGATDLTILPNGNLKISTPLGEIIEEKPISFQGNKEISTEFVLNQNTIGFKLNDEIDPTQPLIIDPCVKWARYFGGNSSESNSHIELDNSGNIYQSGVTYSTNLATSGAHQTTINSQPDAYLAKFNSGGDLLWATYFGGNSTDQPYDCLIDKASDLIYIVGQTQSTNNIATSGAYKTNNSGNIDGFMVQFSSSGTRNWGSYFGGNNYDWLNAGAVDKNGNLIICGTTASTSNITTTSSYQPNIAGSYDGFIAKFNSSGNIQWSTYIGGSSTDYTNAVTLGSGNEIYVTGLTYSTDKISSTGVHQTTNKGNGDCFVMRLSAAGTYTWGTYFGGSLSDEGKSIHCSPNGTLVISGNTVSTSDIATSSAYQTTNKSSSGYNEAFILKLSSTGTRNWSTYVGSTLDDQGIAITTDKSNSIFLALKTQNNGFGSSGSHQNNLAGNDELCLFKFSATGTFQWATYYGGNSTDVPNSITTDTFGAIYVSGYTASASGISFGYSSSNTLNNVDNFIVKFQDGAEMVTKTNINACPFSAQTLTATRTGSSYTWNNGATTSSITVYNQANYKVTTATNLGCKFTDSFFVKRYILDTTANISQNGFFCQSGQPTTLTFNYTQSANSFNWRNATWANLGSGQQISVNQAGTYHMIVRYSTINCFDTLSYSLTQQVFNVKIPKTASISCGGSFAVDITHNSPVNSIPQYSWTPTTTISYTSYGRALIYPNTTTKYILTSTIGGYCQTRDTIDITVTNGTSPKIQRTYDSIQCYGNNYFGFNPVFNNPSSVSRFTKMSPVSVYPGLPDINDTITITYNSNLGNAKLKNASAVYIYTGLITSSSQTDEEWKHVRGNLTTGEAQYKMTSLGGGIWRITLPIKSFYGKNEPFTPSEFGKKLAFIFHNASGSLKGAGIYDDDIYYPMYNPQSFSSVSNQIQAIIPYAGMDTRYVIETGETIPIMIATGEKMSQITLTVGGNSKTVYNTDTVSMFYKANSSFNVQVYAVKSGTPSFNNYHYTHQFNVLNLSTSNTYKWDYGDGNTANSYNLNPVYKSFNDAGTYTVKLDITAGNGCTYAQSQTKVVVRPKAVANITLPPSPFCLNEDFKPSGTGSTITGGTGTLNYFWDFGDGTTGSTISPSKKFNTEGSYTIKLKTTGSNICTDSTARFITIRPQPPVSITASSPYACLNGTSLEATSGFFNYIWNTGQNGPVDYVYSSGTYSVIASTQYGCKSTNSINLIDHPGIQITSDNGLTLCKPTDIINLQATSGFSNYAWNTGSNTRYTSISSPGVYSVTAYDGSCQISNSITVEDGSYINPSIFYTPIEPFTCVFSPQSVHGEYYSWTFGDGNVSILKSPEHTYKKEGEYLVCLDIMNKCKVRNSFCGTVYVPFTVSGTQEIQKSELNIHPNPGTGTYWIDLPNLGTAASISVTDMKGAVVFYKEKFDIHEPIRIECANGMYLVKVQTNNHVFTGKINHFNN